MKPWSLGAFGVLCASAASLCGCGENPVKPLFEGNHEEGKQTTIVISDLHLGADASFAEDSANRQYLVDFLKRLKVTPSIDELVLAGDVFDGWYLPFSYGPIKDYAVLYRTIAKANQEVVDAINAIIQDGRVKVTYVPGNHDVDFSRPMVEEAFPGINQIRDTAGLGAYRTGLRSEIVIEHGHRYNAFCAPDQLTDAALKQKKVLFGPGYFFTRIAASSLLSGHNPRSFAFPEFGLPEGASKHLNDNKIFYNVWDGATSTIGVPGMGFEDKVIPCGLAGFADYYSLADLVPLYRNGVLTNTLFQDFDTNWAKVQTVNGVKDPLDFAVAVAEAAKLPATDAKAYTQYFDMDSQVDVVVFGHTHAPMLEKGTGAYAGKTYANSGTWIDNNGDGDHSTRSFVKVVSSLTGDETVLYGYGTDGSVTVKQQ
jgi:UDP-2,3-diacylglucosamine pyrophosphatase LpxH